MIKLLYQRSLVENFFVSASSQASTPFNKRDLRRNKVLDEISGYHGTTRGKTKKKLFKTVISSIEMIEYVKGSNDICLVCLDFAGLSTNKEDLKRFVRY
jgi:hypothetical protein